MRVCVLIKFAFVCKLMQFDKHVAKHLWYRVRTSVSAAGMPSLLPKNNYVGSNSLLISHIVLAVM